jgi:hypothetical protein
MPGLGRGGIMPGFGRGPPGRGGTAPDPPGCRGAAGRGTADPPLTPNGLLPTRGPGRAVPGGVAGRGAAGAGAGAGVEAAGATGAAGAAGALGAAGAAGAGGCGTTSGWDAAGPGVGAGAACAAFFAGAFFAASGAGAASGNASRSLRATGASTVDDADLTYSPISLSFAIASLLVIPSSLAIADTRILPGTDLLRRGRAHPRDPV